MKFKMSIELIKDIFTVAIALDLRLNLAVHLKMDAS